MSATRRRPASGDAGTPEAALATALESFGSSGRVDRPLPDHGRLHLDRPIPFLAVHRLDGSSASRHLAGLLAAQPTVLLVPPALETAAAVAETAAALHGHARAVLAAELWVAGGPEPPRLTVVAAPDCDVHLVETLLKSLKSADWGEVEPAVEVRYEAAPAPPGATSALPARAEAGDQVIGLELSPWYLDPQTGEPYPARLRGARRALTLCLRQLAFEWLQESEQLAHFHELGRRALEPPVERVDRGLVEIADSFDLILYLSPVNAVDAWHEFESAAFERPPRFRYRGIPSDPARLKERLYALPVEDIDDPALHALFAERRNELDRLATLIRERNTPRFLPCCLAVYGPVEPELLSLAEAILDCLPAPAAGEASCDCEAVAAGGRQEIARLAAQDPGFEATVEIRDDVPGVICSGFTLIVGRDTRVAARRLEALLQHEVGTHLLTAHNGAQQPLQILKVGLANYEELQEGLAVLAEHLAGGLTAARMRLLAARVVAAHAVQEGADFVSTFRLLRERGLPPRRAFGVAMRIHRGGGYVKDLIYLRGLDRLLRHLRSGLAIEDLLVGKVNFEQIEVLSELRHRRVLSPPRLHPRYLDHPDARRRLDRLRRQDGVLALAEEALA